MRKVNKTEEKTPVSARVEVSTVAVDSPSSSSSSLVVSCVWFVAHWHISRCNGAWNKIRSFRVRPRLDLLWLKTNGRRLLPPRPNGCRIPDSIDLFLRLLFSWLSQLNSALVTHFKHWWRLASAGYKNGIDNERINIGIIYKNSRIFHTLSL